MAETLKVALITGSGTGVGKAAALALAKDGYAIVLTGRRKEMIDGVAQEIEALGAKALAVPADIGNPKDVENLFAKTKETFGRLDVLFNNAGIGAPAMPLEESDLRALAGRGQHQSHRRLPLHPAGDPDDEGADAAWRPHHQ